MGAVNRYLSQRERIIAYERQMKEYASFARESDLRHAKLLALLDGQKAEIEKLRRGLAILNAASTNLHNLVALLRAARFGRTWRERRAARRALKETR